MTRVATLAMIAVGLVAGPGCNCGGSTGTPNGGDGGTSGGSSGGASGSSSGGHGSTGGSSSGSSGGSSGCGLRTCQSAHANCGPIGDGCSGSLDCGSCVPPETCGGGGKPSVCGGDGGCIPKSCASAGANCGPLADGCGNLLECGTCDAGSCGLGGKPNVCGESGVGDGGSVIGPDGGCQPLTCLALGFDCGPAGNGCGGSLDCGECDAGTCGGGGHPGVCGAPPTCVPLTCAQALNTCGILPDGCGNVIGPCGPACTGTDVCGGGGVPNQCGDANAVDGGSCTNLCPFQQVSCADGGTTTVTGTVVAGTDPTLGFGNPDPLPNALVYIPNGTVQPFSAGVACDPCGAVASGSPIASATSAVDGGFTLTNVPCGTPNPIPLVIQIGRWQRQVTVGPFACCTTTALTLDDTRMPRNQSEGNIPLIALNTGKVDAHECILRKMGIQDTEFTAPAGGGRVQLYVGNGATDPTSTAPSELSLTSSATTLAEYDEVMFPCWGSEDGQPASPDQPVAQIAQNQQNIIDYTNEGGRVYGTHFSYVWLDNDLKKNKNLPVGPVPFEGTATWDLNAGTWTSTCDGTGATPCLVDIDQSFPKGALLAQWLQVVGASTTLGVIPQLDDPRWDFDAIIPPSENWLQWPGNVPAGETYTPIHYTFNTPVGADGGTQCGRVVFSDFHVENATSTAGQVFPAECGAAAPMTAQEKVLEFMLFDLASCITQTGPPTGVCTPLNCAQQGYSCGSWGDGCGDAIQCGVCDAGTCGGGGTPGVCGAPTCAPLNCKQLGYDCGPAGDGCGGQLSCGGCDGGTCGGGGVASVCGSGGGVCTPLTCQEQNLQCGPAGNGCGGLIDGGCGSCSGFEGGSNATCGGGGVPGVCGTPSCTPQTCAGLGYDCGAAGDGCGNLLQCGSCDAGTCGGGGQANVCGSSTFE